MQKDLDTLQKWKQHRDFDHKFQIYVDVTGLPAREKTLTIAKTPWMTQPHAEYAVKKATGKGSFIRRTTQPMLTMLRYQQ